MIAYCTGVDCPLSNRCKRTEYWEGSTLELWISSKYNEDTNSCDFYIP